MSITVTTPRSVESATRLDVSANACMIVAATAATRKQLCQPWQKKRYDLTVHAYTPHKRKSPKARQVGVRTQQHDELQHHVLRTARHSQRKHHRQTTTCQQLRHAGSHSGFHSCRSWAPCLAQGGTHPPLQAQVLRALPVAVARAHRVLRRLVCGAPARNSRSQPRMRTNMQERQPSQQKERWATHHCCREATPAESQRSADQ